MEGLFTLLLFAGFFYFMMRFGCGAHMVHGHGGHGGGGAHGEHGPHGGHGGAGGTARDPVCGMSVDEGQGYAEMREGKMLRFCSRRCLDQFDEDPGRYLAAKGGAI
jgi:YHS domain-containing protein